MNVKTKVIVSAVVLAAVFAAGRVSAPEKVRVETQIVEVEKKKTDTKTATDRERHRKTTTVTEKLPDGTKRTTTTTTDDTQTDRKTDSSTSDVIAKKEDTSKEIVRGDSKVSLSFLAGLKVTDPKTPVYGACISKPILGPVTVGLWGLDDKTVGASIGLQF